MGQEELSTLFGNESPSAQKLLAIKPSGKVAYGSSRVKKAPPTRQLIRYGVFARRNSGESKGTSFQIAVDLAVGMVWFASKAPVSVQIETFELPLKALTCVTKIF